MDNLNQSTKERQDLKEHNFSELQKLYFHSRDMNALGIFMWIISVPVVLYLVFVIWVAISHHVQMNLNLFISALLIYGYTGLYVLTAYICFSRKSWGRIPGIIIFSIFLLGIPIGTIMGIYGINAFSEKSLFGPDRLTHSRLKAEYKFRKKNKIG